MVTSSFISSLWVTECEGIINQQTLHWQETLFPVPDLGWISTWCSCVFMFEIDFVPRRDCGLVEQLNASEYCSACFPMWVISRRGYGSWLFFLFFPRFKKDGRLYRGADRQSFSTRRLLAASHTRLCSEMVWLRCDRPTNGFYCLNLETLFCQSVTRMLCSSKRHKLR